MPFVLRRYGRNKGARISTRDTVPRFDKLALSHNSNISSQNQRGDDKSLLLSCQRDFQSGRCL